jgi:uncharacterized membrane protein
VISNRPSRLVFVDLLRGLAILAMVETHVFNAFLDTTIRSSAWFDHLNYYKGLVAPSFLFVSGWVFIVSSQRKLQDFQNFGPAFRKQLWRIAQIWILGYCLHFPKYSYSIVRHWTNLADWQQFYTVDILHCIAAGLLILLFGRIFVHRDTHLEFSLWGICLAVFLTTPWVWELNLSHSIPVALAGYFQEGPTSYFPLFPWFGFFGVGATCALRHLEFTKSGKERLFFTYLGIAAVVLIAAGHWFHLLHFQIYYGSSNVRAQPHFGGMRLGYVFALVLVCRLLQEVSFWGKSWLLAASRESLMIYVVHLLIIYRFPYQHGTLYEQWGHDLSFNQCIATIMGMMVLMISLAYLWSWMKIRHLQTFRRIVFATCVVIVIGFFFR